ncbi:MAG: hypothetical protein F6K28_61735 [Microcoleus sp. SIO2G3]|nr:hypothetical protein [Microcoleus sp. SIO2G3]
MLCRTTRLTHLRADLAIARSADSQKRRGRSMLKSAHRQQVIRRQLR